MPRLSLWALSAALAACSQAAPRLTPGPTQTLLPRVTAQPTETSSLGQEVAPLETQGPTPTPLTHRVSAGDTLLSIALDYGVDLADLLLANPGVNPRLLSLGQGITIPRSGAQGPVPSATPHPLRLSPVSCYATAFDALVCMLTASTESEPALEGIVALITLVDAAGVPLVTAPAFAPVNLLVPGSPLPLSASFAAPVPDFETASAVAISALQAADLESRYARTELTVRDTQIASDGRSAAASGTVEISDLELENDLILRVAVLALGEDGTLAGYRVWEPSEQTEAIEFELGVSSLGPTIHSIHVLAEAARLP